ncbi:hypothetical protein BDN72DRAFT_833872 [Pluteus cervinus]|uniref:Uncharacterized protein n=1 Tax=Pluteus cervinus TaxID=181527 RepID=A0ACD3B8X7_9AGAR|nr:hypothetical protein BDN72DRAFT_833872 [Pluteus cervinus]
MLGSHNAQGNILCNFVDLSGRPGYQYRNSNGSYYFNDTDGSSYYNNGRGYARYTYPGNRKVLEIFKSRLRRKDFNPRALDLDLYRSEFPELQEEMEEGGYDEDLLVAETTDLSIGLGNEEDEDKKPGIDSGPVVKKDLIKEEEEESLKLKPITKSLVKKEEPVD